MDDDQLDAVIIGGGPAGLSAAIYLARFGRRFRLVHSDEARAGWIPRTRNHPGFPRGIRGVDLLSRMRRQAERYGAQIDEGRVVAIEDLEYGFRVHLEDGPPLACLFLILATGVADNEPPLPDLFGAVQKGLIRICPICDAYEVRGKRIGVIGSGDHAAREARFIRHFTKRVALLRVGDERLSEAERTGLDECGIDIVETAITRVHLEKDRITALDLEDGEHRSFDAIYSAWGVTSRSQLALDLGVALTKDGRLQVDEHQMTTVDRFYAAGDVVRGLNQITVAEAEGAIAAVDIHNRLSALRPFEARFGD